MAFEVRVKTVWVVAGGFAVWVVGCWGGVVETVIVREVGRFGCAIISYQHLTFAVLSSFLFSLYWPIRTCHCHKKHFVHNKISLLVVICAEKISSGFNNFV